MNTLKKITKALSISDIVICLLTIVLSILFPVLDDIFATFSDDLFDFILWTVIIFFILAVINVLFFSITLIIYCVQCKKIIKEKSVIIAHVVNIIFVLLVIVFIDDLNLWFVFV